MKYFVLAALLALANAAVYNGVSPPESFKNMSPADGNDWGNRSKVGAALGFIVFGCAYLATVVAIFLDIKKSGANYDDMIKEDIQEIKSLGLSGKLSEFEAELAIRLSGNTKDASVDDQLLGEALKLSYDQYKQYM